MRAHVNSHSSPVRSHTEEHVATLNRLARQLAEELGITQSSDKNEVLARVLALDALGKTPAEITKLVVRLHSHGRTAGRWERKSRPS